MILFDRFWVKRGFLAAPETLANRLFLIGLVSRQELCNCLVDCRYWLGLCYRGVSVVLQIGLHCLLSFKKVMFLLYLISIIYFFLLYISQDIENARWFTGQLGYLVLLGQSYSMRSRPLWSHLPPAKCRLHLSLWCSYLWYLQHLKGAGMFCFTLSRKCMYVCINTFVTYMLHTLTHKHYYIYIYIYIYIVYV